MILPFSLSSSHKPWWYIVSIMSYTYFSIQPILNTQCGELFIVNFIIVVLYSPKMLQKGNLVKKNFMIYAAKNLWQITRFLQYGFFLTDFNTPFILFGLSTLLWLGSCNQCILACFHWSKKHKHSSSNHVLCCFNSHRPRVSLAEILLFSLIFSQALLMSLVSLKFSKAANLVRS